MKVSVIGTGYVGLVSGVCLAEKGHEVTCVDVDRAKVDQINRGVPPIHEEGLQPLLKRNLGGRFRATTDLRQAVLERAVSLIAVGTPFDGDQIDLRYIKEAARQIGAVIGVATLIAVIGSPTSPDDALDHFRIAWIIAATAALASAAVSSFQRRPAPVPVPLREPAVAQTT